MTEKDLILSLTGNEYRVYSYIREMCHGDAVVMKKDKIQTDLNLSYATTFNIIKKLETAAIIEYNGRKRRFRILERGRIA